MDKKRREESFIRPLSVRLLSVYYPFAIPFASFCDLSFSYPFSVFSSGGKSVSEEKVNIDIEMLIHIYKGES